MLPGATHWVGMGHQVRRNREALGSPLNASPEPRMRCCFAAFAHLSSYSLKTFWAFFSGKYKVRTFFVHPLPASEQCVHLGGLAAKKEVSSQPMRPSDQGRLFQPHETRRPCAAFWRRCAGRGSQEVDPHMQTGDACMGRHAAYRAKPVLWGVGSGGWGGVRRLGRRFGREFCGATFKEQGPPSSARSHPFFGWEGSLLK